ncbi:hypothetical protein ACROYT_G015262 [Oculina patagonica]
MLHHVLPSGRMSTAGVAIEGPGENGSVSDWLEVYSAMFGTPFKVPRKLNKDDNSREKLPKVQSAEITRWAYRGLLAVKPVKKVLTMVNDSGIDLPVHQGRSKKLTSEHTHTGSGAPKTEKSLQGKCPTELNLVIPWLMMNLGAGALNVSLGGGGQVQAADRRYPWQPWKQEPPQEQPLTDTVTLSFELWI